MTTRKKIVVILALIIASLAWIYLPDQGIVISIAIGVALLAVFRFLD